MLHETDFLENQLRDVAEKMILAARTAPKARGRDQLFTALAGKEEIKKLAERMETIANESGEAFFARDAGNIRSVPWVVLLGTRIEPAGLKVCGMCGFGNCDNKRQHPEVPCVFNTGDLGIALGSAVSVAMDHRADNRIMYTIGQAAMDLGLFPPEVKVAYGIPLSATAKNPFFDRK